MTTFRRGAVETAPGGACPGALFAGGSAGALLFLPPLAEERKGTLRPAAAFARALAARRWTALLYDPRGTGEAPGAFPEVTRESLHEDARAARDLLWRAAPGAPLVLASVRSGARLAVRLAAESPPADGLLLWEPALDTAAWWRSAQRRSRFRGGGAGRDERDIDGYRFSDALVRALVAPDPLPETPPAPAAVLSVSPSGRPTREAARAAELLGGSCRAVAMPPFWLETGEVDPGPLLAASISAFADIGFSVEDPS